MKRYHEFAQVCSEQITAALTQEEVLDQAASVIAESIKNDGILHVFGCGHSQMFGEELCFRTGGLGAVNAIMTPYYGIYPHYRLSQLMERQEGFADTVFNMMNPQKQDVMLIVSVSGRNPAGIDMAMAAKKMGMIVIACTSLDYSNHVTSRHSSGLLLKDVADIVIDVCGVEGDAVLSHPDIKEKFCSTSTVVTMTVLVGLIGQVIEILADQGIEPPIWVSGNLDRGDEVNQKIAARYHDRVDIL